MQTCSDLFSGNFTRLGPGTDQALGGEKGQYMSLDAKKSAMERAKGRQSLGHAFDADNGIMH